MGKKRNKRYTNSYFAKRRKAKLMLDLLPKDNNEFHAYQKTERENEKFIQYYKLQNICPENEWSEFLAILKTDLPTSFRISASCAIEAKQLLQLIEGGLFTDLLEGQMSEDEKCKPICLSWYPQRFGWQLQLTRKHIRGSEAYYRLHNFLINETENGNISRQEIVSMIPPLLLDVKPSDKVLDMCASPGSKTAQLIENLYSGSTAIIPDGLVIANDVHNGRCYMLVHQAKRLNSANVMIVNHDASHLPSFYLDDSGNSVLKFDKILCDVPCSGDATLRKNADIWLKWAPGNANNLHGIQYRILKRGLELLKVGGRLVYSTCSFNPIENEAVIQRILIESEDSVVIVDERDKLVGLKTMNGLSQWTITSKDLNIYNTFDEVPENLKTQIRPQMFSLKEDKYNLNKCIRILPHHQDSGGFFVSVLEKLKPLPWEMIMKNNTEIEIIKNPVISRRKFKKPHQGYKEDPFVFLTNDDPVWPEIRDFFELNNNFPIHCLLTRCTVGKKKNIYFISQSIRDMLCNNQERVKIINTGVKTFVRCDNKSMYSNFRVAQEGLTSISSYIGSKRRIQLTRNEIIKILVNPTIAINDLNESTTKKLLNFEVGSCILNMIDDNLPIEIVGWKGFSTLKAYVDVECRLHYLRLTGEDVSEFDVNKFRKEKSDEPTGVEFTEADTAYIDVNKFRKEKSDEPTGVEFTEADTAYIDLNKIKEDKLNEPMDDEPTDKDTTFIDAKKIKK